MGINISSQTKTLDCTNLKDGKKPSVKDPVIIRVTTSGFIPSEVTLFSGQLICWEWESEDPDIEHNIKQANIYTREFGRSRELLCKTEPQVTLSGISGQLPTPVPHGLCSSQACVAGSYEVNIFTPGSYHFISEGYDTPCIGHVKVIATPPEVIKVSGLGFTPGFVEINEGESVTWQWESVRGSLTQLEFCSQHGGITSNKINVKPDEGNSNTYTQYFKTPGLFYFSGDSEKQFCTVKVVYNKREYSIQFLEEKAEPALINGYVGDRIWVQNTSTMAKHRSLMVQSEDGGILVSSRTTSVSTAGRGAKLISYCFAIPGVYRVLCTSGINTIRCCVLVQPKPRDYVICVSQEGFEPELGSVQQGDRIWWKWTGEEETGFYIEEDKRTAIAHIDISREPECRCVESNEHLTSVGLVGFLSTIAYTPGLFTYRLKAIGDWAPHDDAVCSIITQSVAKNHVVRVSDHGFQPQIVNVHPGDSVTWMWCDTYKSHTLQQVSHERKLMKDGFHSNVSSAPPDAISHVFTDLGVFYFTSANLSAVYGAVVVTAGNQVHKVEVTLHGIDPDPLGVRVGDIVCWRWNTDQLYSINSIKSPDQIDQIVKDQDVPVKRRCFAQSFNKTGIHHFVCTAYLGDEDEPSLHPCDQFINTIYVDPASYSGRVKVSRDGFQPHAVVLAKHECVLWSWDRSYDEDHNILSIHNPGEQAASVRAVRGLSSFESGPLTKCSSFFHTFDTPGTYWVTSQGTDHKTCRVDVLAEAKRVLPPRIAKGNDGGNVELGYTVFMTCADDGVDILYTLDGTVPVDKLTVNKVYDWQEGIKLEQPGLYLIRAISIRDGWIPSDVFTSKRFWVLCEDEDEEDEHQEKAVDLGLRQEITNWQWYSCTPTISYTKVFDNVIHVDFTLPPTAQVSWIGGFQLYLNGVSYGGWLCASCPGVQVSGLTGGRVYHVVIVVFPAREEFSPQLSNELIVNCPMSSSLGGPVVSLETCNRVDAVVIVWPVYQGCLYSLLMDGQPMGDQFCPEQDVDYCRVLFESENSQDERTFNVSVVMTVEDQQLLSNEIQFTLPLPNEMIQSNESSQTLQPTVERTGSTTSSANESRELLIVAELSVAKRPSSPENEASPYFNHSPLKNMLDTIGEDEQLNVFTSTGREHGAQETATEENSTQMAANDEPIGQDRERSEGDSNDADNIVDEKMDPIFEQQEDLKMDDNEEKIHVESTDVTNSTATNDENNEQNVVENGNPAATRVEQEQLTLQNTEDITLNNDSNTEKNEDTQISCSVEEREEFVCEDDIHEFQNYDVFVFIEIAESWQECFALSKKIEIFEETLQVIENTEKGLTVFCAIEVIQTLEVANEFLVNPVVTCLSVYEGSLCVSQGKTKEKIVELGNPGKEIQKDSDEAGIRSQRATGLEIAVKGTSAHGVVLEWEDKTHVIYPVYSLVVFGFKFSSDIDSQQRFGFNDSPTPEIWPSNQIRDACVQHCWTTDQNVIEIRGLRPRHRYSIAVVVSSRDDPITRLRSDVITLTMPGRPKAPVIHVTAHTDRQFTISWRPCCCYGDAKIVGYKLLVDGAQYGDLLPYDTVEHVSNLQHGTSQQVSLVASTNHSVGDSTPSNAVTIACPHPPPPPEIIETPTNSPNAVSISWAPVTMVTDPGQLRLLSSYSVFVDGVFHGSCPVSDVTDIFMDFFAYNIPGCFAGREYLVYVRGHVDPQTINSTQPVHICGCYGDQSNILQVYCAGAAVLPVLGIDSMNSERVQVSWDKPRVYGTLTGYVLHVDGEVYGNILDPQCLSATLTGLSLGNDITVTLTVLTDLPNEDRHLNQQVFEPALRANAAVHEDSGVESSSSVFIDKRESGQTSRPLTIHLWGFVKSVVDIQVKEVCCCSAVLEWSVGQTGVKSEGEHDVFTDPEQYRVKSWKSDQQHVEELEPLDTLNDSLVLKDLSPSSRYGVLIEATAGYPNHIKDDSCWNVSRSDKIWFDTKPAPDPLKNVHVVTSTLNSVRLAWDGCHRYIQLDMYKAHDDDDNMPTSSVALMHIVLNPHMTSYTIHSLDPKTRYLFSLKTSNAQTNTQNDAHECNGQTTSLEAWSSGIDRPRDLHVTKRTPFSLHVAWKPAVAYGDLEILYYLVHYSEKVRTSSMKNNQSLRVPHGSVMGPLHEINDLEPGAAYGIVVEAVVGIREKKVDENSQEDEDKQINDGDEVASSIGSSESDWVSLVTHDCLSKSITSSTTAPPGLPGLFVTGMSATQIHLSWNVPASLRLDSEEQIEAERREHRGRVRQVSGYTLEVNGRIVTKLPPSKQNFTLKRCKPGMKYTCYFVVMTTPGDSGGKRNKKVAEEKKKKVITAVDGMELDSDDEDSDSFQEARSQPLEVTIPRQDHPIVLNVHYSPTRTQVSSISSSSSEEPEDGSVIVEWKASTPVKCVTSYKVVWRGSLDEAKNDSKISSSTTSYEICPVKQKSVYSVWLEVSRDDDPSPVSYGPLHCQVPGRPEPPWIWCRGLSAYRILVEWNEPRTYGIDTIRAYQVNLNGRQLGKLLSPQTRKVAVHCQPSSVYRITLLTVTTDPHLGGSDQSNVLTVCTPSATDKSLDPKQNIRIKALWADNDSIAVEWSDDNDLLTVDHYVIKWSSVLQPQSQEQIVPVEEISRTIEDCKAGTRHFIAVAAIDDRGKLVSKSPQLIVQTSAPLAEPRLRLCSSLPSGIHVEWDKPVSIGDAQVNAYEIKVDDLVQDTLSNSDQSYVWTHCSPCASYTVQIKALSTKDDCHSNWSEPLLVTCPGAYITSFTRAPSNHVNDIHVTWNTPQLVGGATIESFKVHYLASEETGLTSNDVITNPSSITHDPLESHVLEDTLNNALPTLPYWVVLEVTLLPCGCHTLYSTPIKARVAVPPDPPVLTVVVIGRNERRTLERYLCRLAQVKDRICQKLQILQNSVIVKGSKQKDIQIKNNLVALHNLEIELNNCAQAIKDVTGLVNVEVTWTEPRDDDDARITGYQVFIDGHEHDQPLDKHILYKSLELIASLCDHVITVKALTSHPIGHSAPSNHVTVCGKDFVPFVQFCYFGVHCESKACNYEDTLTHEAKNKILATHRGSLGKPLPSPVCHVMDVDRSCTQLLVPARSTKPRAILFWTIWCQSSIKAMEMFVEFSQHYSHQFDLTTCCVQSNQPVSSHHQSLHALLTSRGWLSSSTSIQHTCGCSAESRDGTADVSHMFGLFGVPSIVLCNQEGRMAWQGRCCAQDYAEYQQFICHALSDALGQPCPVPSCTQCSLEHELNTSEIPGYPTQIPGSDPGARYRYKGANRDSSLEVTGCLSTHRIEERNDISPYGESLDTTRKSRRKNLTNKLHPNEVIHLDTLQDTESLHRRLHGSRPYSSAPYKHTKTSTHKQTITSNNHRTQARAKTASTTRTSVFTDRFSLSMSSSLPSLDRRTSELVAKRTTTHSALSKPKTKISVDEFFPV